MNYIRPIILATFFNAASVNFSIADDFILLNNIENLLVAKRTEQIKRMGALSEILAKRTINDMIDLTPVGVTPIPDSLETIAKESVIGDLQEQIIELGVNTIGENYTKSAIEAARIEAKATVAKYKPEILAILAANKEKKLKLKRH